MGSSRAAKETLTKIHLLTWKPNVQQQNYIKKTLSYSTNKKYYLVFLQCGQIQLDKKKVFVGKRVSEKQFLFLVHILMHKEANMGKSRNNRGISLCSSDIFFQVFSR